MIVLVPSIADRIRENDRAGLPTTKQEMADLLGLELPRPSDSYLVGADKKGKLEQALKQVLAALRSDHAIHLRWDVGAAGYWLVPHHERAGVAARRAHTGVRRVIHRSEDILRSVDRSALTNLQCTEVVDVGLRLSRVRDAAEANLAAASVAPSISSRAP